ncbi:MAG: DUF4129 domain-containing protein, partial [Sulfuricella sp.]|nr:DUF4129 domain-containing protein [Sulfuricella sp.]
AAALPAGEPLPLLARMDSAWLVQLRMSWDTLNNDWNQWVLGYGQERQYDLLSRLGFEMASWKELTAGLVAGVGALLLAFSGFMLWRRVPVGADPAAAIYQRFCRKLARAGIVRQPNEGPTDFAKRITRSRPDLALSAASISELYIALRYAPQPNASDLRQLGERVKAFRPK